jgi:ubiquinone/menaquinone biosynthesis C-methylase UbiE
MDAMDADTKKTVDSFNACVEQYYNNISRLAPLVEPSIQKFIRLIPRNGKILDAGCGPGRDSRRFSELGYSVVGVDLADRMVAFAKRLAPSVDFRVMDIRSMEFPDASFDGAWANSSLMFMKKKDAPRALRELHRVMKKGGCMFLRFKEGEGEGMAVDKRYGDAEKYTAYYGRDELIKLIEGSGFSVMLTDRESPPYQYATHSFITAYCKKPAQKAATGKS